jgi:hypothetical protein
VDKGTEGIGEMKHLALKKGIAVLLLGMSQVHTLKIASFSWPWGWYESRR